MKTIPSFINLLLDISSLTPREESQSSLNQEQISLVINHFKLSNDTNEHEAKKFLNEEASKILSGIEIHGFKYLNTFFEFLDKEAVEYETRTGRYSYVSKNEHIFPYPGRRFVADQETGTLRPRKLVEGGFNFK